MKNKDYETIKAEIRAEAMDKFFNKMSVTIEKTDGISEKSRVELLKDMFEIGKEIVGGEENE